LDLLIKNGLIFDPSSEYLAPEKKDILIRNRRIIEIEGKIAPFPDSIRVIEAKDKLVMPGLINSHLHSHDHFDRGRFDNLPLELWILFIRPWIGAKPLTRRELYLRTLIGALEMAHNGITLAVDDVNLTPFNTLENVQAVMQAYLDVGMRARVSASVFDQPAYLSVPYVDELLPQTIRQQMDQAKQFTPQGWISFLRDCLAAWNHPEELTRFILAPSAPQRCTDDLLIKMKGLSEQANTFLMTHTLETKVQKITGPLLYGKSVIGHLADLGILGRNISLVHCVWVSDEDLDLIASSGASVVHCPISNLKLGSGIAPLEKMIQRKILIGLGTDNTSCNDTQNIFEVMKFAALLPKVQHSDFSRWPESAEILKMATIGGAGIARMEGQVGKLTPGSKADLVLLDLRNISFLPMGKIERNLVFSENGGAVDTLIVNGDIILQNKRITKINEAEIYLEIEDAATRLKKEHRSVYEKAEEIYPYFKEAYFRCHKKFDEMVR
jgi:5-methylthioadenosine/S-adenosylhomocysteine deaminase